MNTDHEYDEEQRDFVLAALVQRGRVLSAEIKAMNEEKAQLLARLDELTPVGWNLVVDGVKAQKTAGSRSFDPALAVARFTPEELETCRAEGLDAKKIRELAAAKGLTEACMAPPSADKASIRLA